MHVARGDYLRAMVVRIPGEVHVLVPHGADRTQVEAATDALLTPEEIVAGRDGLAAPCGCAIPEALRSYVFTEVCPTHPSTGSSESFGRFRS